MAIFKFVISHKNKSYQIEKDQANCEALIGKKIGERFAADIIGLNSYELQITGGSDKDGFPMRKDIEGTIRKRLIVTEGIGFKAVKKKGKKKYKIKGLRKRKMLRGNMIGNDIVQINCKVLKVGEKPLEEIVPKKSEKKESLKEAEQKKEDKTQVKESAEKKEVKIKEETKTGQKIQKPIEQKAGDKK